MEKGSIAIHRDLSVTERGSSDVEKPFFTDWAKFLGKLGLASREFGLVTNKGQKKVAQSQC